jgi:hypothetical protein
VPYRNFSQRELYGIEDEERRKANQELARRTNRSATFLRIRQGVSQEEEVIDIFLTFFSIVSIEHYLVLTK